jgi:hypothetical protein
MTICLELAPQVARTCNYVAQVADAADQVILLELSINIHMCQTNLGKNTMLYSGKGFITNGTGWPWRSVLPRT